MNHEIPLFLPKISDFPYLNDSFLDQFSAVYMPDMSRAEVKACRSYYLRHRRVPSGASELAFLNALAQKKRREPDAFLISEMMTDDAFLAETFADLMAKRAAVTPDYKMPCSLAEIPTVAQKYLAARTAGKDPFERISVSAAPAPMLALSAKKIQPTLLCGDTQSGFSGGITPSHALTYSAPLAEYDKIYALLKSTDPAKDFEETLLRFATSQVAQSRAKRLFPIGKRGVFGACTALDTGFEVDLVRLYGEKTPATRLLENEVGMLIVAKESEAAALLIDALDIGLRPRLVGHLRKDECIHIYESADTVFHLSLHFIASFAFSRAYRAEMNPSVALPFVPTALEESCPTLGKEKLFAVHVSTDSARHAALYASLHAIAACVALGADPRDIRVAERFSLSLSSTSPEAIGTQLALLLGFYRAVTEFELSELDSLVLADETDAGFSLCATVREPEAPTPRRLISQSSRVYLLEPTYDENGNPDFEDMKKMLDYVGKLRRDGGILSARAVTGDVLPVLEEMSENSLAEYVGEPRSALPGSILIETKLEIQGFLLARTCEPETVTEETE